MAEIANFLKYKVKRDFVDPTYEEISQLSFIFKEYNFKNEMSLLTEFQEKFEEYLVDLDKVGWDEYKTSDKIWDDLQYLRKKLNYVTNLRLYELGF